MTPHRPPQPARTEAVRAKLLVTIDMMGDSLRARYEAGTLGTIEETDVTGYDYEFYPFSQAGVCVRREEIEILTATPHRPPQPARTEAERHRETYRNLMRRIDTGLFSRDDAFTLIHVSLELGRMGYKLTRDESDWQPVDAREGDEDGR